MITFTSAFSCRAWNAQSDSAAWASARGQPITFPAFAFTHLDCCSREGSLQYIAFSSCWCLYLEVQTQMFELPMPPACVGGTSSRSTLSVDRHRGFLGSGRYPWASNTSFHFVFLACVPLLYVSGSNVSTKVSVASASTRGSYHRQRVLMLQAPRPEWARLNRVGSFSPRVLVALFRCTAEDVFRC